MEIRTRAARPPSGDPAIWALAYVDIADSDGRGFLDADQYAHAVELFDELASETDPRRPRKLSVKKIDQFFELRDKGGILGKINLRVFFAVLDASKTILVLGSIKKEDEGAVPRYIVTKMRNRLHQARTAMDAEERP
jgi:hypothetical protein